MSSETTVSPRNGEFAISARGLSKMYRLYDRPGDRLKEALHPFRKTYHREFWALRDVDLDVRPGETVGIIGVNGSGKSTLLQAVCGVLRPTAGEVQARGTVSALLELGSGFNPEFTGRENVRLQGAILGLSRPEIDRRFGAIAEFADIGEFLERPVKTYSTGMLVRLAFSVAINVDPDILIVDEALSVGDVFFQAKCFNRIQQLRGGRTAILLVSHEMNTVRALCDRVLLLDGGAVVCEGEPRTVIETYFKRRARITGSVDLAGEAGGAHPRPPVPPSAASPAGPLAPAEIPAGGPAREEEPAGAAVQALHYGNGKARLVDYSVDGLRRPREVTVVSGSELEVVLTHEVLYDIAKPIVAVMLRTPNGIELYGNNTTFKKVGMGPLRAGGVVTTVFRQRIHLNNGQYMLTLMAGEWVNDSVVYVDRYVDAVLLVVNGGPYPYSGICNLEGSIEVSVSR